MCSRSPDLRASDRSESPQLQLLLQLENHADCYTLVVSASGSRGEQRKLTAVAAECTMSARMILNNQLPSRIGMSTHPIILPWHMQLQLLPNPYWDQPTLMRVAHVTVQSPANTSGPRFSVPRQIPAPLLTPTQQRML